DFLEIYVPVTQRAEIPVAARVCEVRVPAKNADGAIAVAPPGVFHVSVENSLSEGADKFHIIHVLVAQMRRIVVEAETLVPLDRVDRTLGAGDVESDFRGMHLERKIDIFLVKSIEDRRPAPGEIVEAFLPVLLIGRRKRIDAVPDA